MTGRQIGIAGGGPVHVANFDEALVESINDNTAVQEAINGITPDKGYFANEAAILALYPNTIADPTIRAGWFCRNEATDTIWLWDVDGNKWVNSGGSSIVTSVFGRTGDVTATTADIADSADKRYCTDAQKTVIGNTSGSNTGDQTDATITITDVTTNDVSTTKHGWFPKLPSPTGLYLKDDLTWDTPAGGGESFNVDGGVADTVYGAITAIDGGTA